MTTPRKSQTAAQLLVKCLEAEGVKYVFGLPGEENIAFIRALDHSSIRFILVRHEQGASFMADIYGRLTGKAGVCAATLGPGAINLLLGTADAQTDSTPLVAISAQVGLDRIYKESHQIIDLVAMFRPVTKWADTVLSAPALPEMVRRAFDCAEQERPGATYLAIPEGIESTTLPANIAPLIRRPTHHSQPNTQHIQNAVAMIEKARHPIILAGHGAVRANAGDALTTLAEALNTPVATTFMAKGIIPDDHPLALGVVGFMLKDYENFAFDQADLIISIGYELQEFSPSRINPNADKQIVHVHHFAEEMDRCYQIDISIEADITASLNALNAAIKPKPVQPWPTMTRIQSIRQHELQKGAYDDRFPMAPQRIVSDIRDALAPDDIVLVDTGALKMWMARLYPTYEPLTCVISNGLSTMAWTLPGALGAALARPQQRVLATMGDGSFLMNSQEIETAVRESIPLKVLVWEDKSYGLIKWKMDMEMGNHADVDFSNPKWEAYIESMGARAYRITASDELRPALTQAMDEPGVSVIVCPVDYSENMALIERLGALHNGI